MNSYRLVCQKQIKVVLITALCWLILTPDGKPAAAEREVSDIRAIPEALVYMDAAGDDHPEFNFALIVDKRRQQARLYRRDGYWRMMEKWPCSTGKLAGPKEREGDQRTPEGIYFVKRDVGGRYLSETYGVRALTLDYPNSLDKYMSRSGSAIWLHGTNKALQGRNSNGCVVFENQAIDRLAQFVRLNRTPIIIVDRIRYRTVRDSQTLAENILAAAKQWQDAMMYGSFKAFSKWYGSHAGPSMEWWQRWCVQRRKAGGEAIYQSMMDQKAIYQSGDHYVLLFDHYLKIASRSQWVGRRKLFIGLEGDNVRILGDAYQTAACRRTDPLLYVWRELWQAVENQHEVAAKSKNGQDT